MPLRRPLHLIPTAIGAALLTLVITVGAAVMPSGPTALAATSVPRGSVSISFTGEGIWGGSLYATDALTNRPVAAQFYVSKRYPVGGAAAPVTASVERKPIGTGTWKATGQRVTTRSATFRVHLPAYSTSSTAADRTLLYRLHVSRAGIVGHGDTSDPVTVHYRNPNHFSPLMKYLYRAVHPYCGSAVPRLAKLGDAAGDFTTGQYSLRIDTTVTKYDATDQRSVALHECGHYLQWRNYGATSAGWDRMRRDARAIFAASSSDRVTTSSLRVDHMVEHMADCIAKVANPRGYLGYGGVCTASQKHAAERMLHGLRAR